MLELLSIEWLKLRKYRTFWIISLCFLGLLLLFFHLMRQGTASVSFDNLLLDKSFSFPFIWNLLTYTASYFVYILGCLIIILITNEYVYRTNRQNVIDGWSKLDFLHGKVLLVLFASIIATVWVLLIGLIYGSLVPGTTGPLTSINKVFFFFIYTLNHLGLAFLLAFLFKRSGLAIGLYFLYIMMIEFIIGKILDNRVYEGLGSFMPLESSDKLLPLPLSDMAKKMMHPQQDYTNSSFIIASIIYIIIYYLVIRRLLLKSDW